MWWCNGAPESKWSLDKASGTLRATGGAKSGTCLSSSPKTIPNPVAHPPLDPVRNPVRCKNGCLSAPCSGYPFCDTKRSAQARAWVVAESVGHRLCVGLGAVAALCVSMQLLGPRRK